MKRILVFVLCLVMMASLFAISASAEEAPTETSEITEEAKAEILDTVKDWIEKVTSSTSVATMIATVLGFGSTVALVASKMKVILDMIAKKADAKQIASAVEGSAKEITEAFKGELDGLKVKLSEEEERNKMLSGVLGIAFSYSKDIPASARAQIMALLNGTAEKCDTVEKIVEVAKEAIEKAEETAVKEETPALDQIVGNIVMG